jgi:hypothetical protein
MTAGSNEMCTAGGMNDLQQHFPPGNQAWLSPVNSSKKVLKGTQQCPRAKWLCACQHASDLHLQQLRQTSHHLGCQR